MVGMKIFAVLLGISAVAPKFEVFPKFFGCRSLRRG